MCRHTGVVGGLFKRLENMSCRLIKPKHQSVATIPQTLLFMVVITAQLPRPACGAGACGALEVVVVVLVVVVLVVVVVVVGMLWRW